jgi:hypothetical protein
MAVESDYVATYKSRIGQPAHAEYALASALTEGTAGYLLGRADLYATTLRPVRDAMAAGILSDRHARAIERGFESVLYSNPDVVSALLDRVLAYAPSHTPRQIVSTIRRWLAIEDPRDAEQRHREALARRGVEHTITADGLGELYISGNPIYTYAVFKAICASAAFDKSHAEEGDDRTLAQHRADLTLGLLYDATLPYKATDLESSVASILTHMRRTEERAQPFGPPLLATVDSSELSDWHRLRCAALMRLLEPDELGEAEPEAEDPRDDYVIEWGPPQRGRLRRSGVTPIQINIVMDDSTARGLADNPAVVDGQFSLPASVVRRFAHQADFRRLIVDDVEGRLLAVSPHVYVPSRELRLYAVLEHQTCQAPGCDKPADQCQLDHRVPFNHADPTAGGLTTRENVGPLCGPEHQRKTEGGYKLEQRTDGRFWITPLGRAYRIDSVDLRPGKIPQPRPIVEPFTHSNDGG